MEKLEKTFGKDVQFFLVYIREAHPTDGRQVRTNLRDQVLFKQPKSLEERETVAKQMCSKLDINLPTLMDRLDDKVNKAYSASPDRIYLVGKDGKIAYKGGQGPWGFRPDELEKAIQQELAKIKSQKPKQDSDKDSSSTTK